MADLREYLITLYLTILTKKNSNVFVYKSFAQYFNNIAAKWNNCLNKPFITFWYIFLWVEVISEVSYKNK